MSNNDSMQFTKRSTSASPFFNHQNQGQTQGRIGATDNPAGGEVRPTDYLNKQNSSGVTKNIGADVPAKPRQ
jgi:hypothetical protein